MADLNTQNCGLREHRYLEVTGIVSTKHWYNILESRISHSTKNEEI